MTATQAREYPTPTLEIGPERPCLDTVLHIRVCGLPPGGEVTLEARQAGPWGLLWESAATFAADGDGTVDLARDAPVRGSYRHADPVGLVWSMTPAGAAPEAGPADQRTPVRLDVAASAGAVEIGAARCERLRIPDGLRRVEVRDQGLVGVLYVPDDDRPRPGVLLLGGAEGGLHEDDAALLAAHGFAVLALAYYGAPSRPATLERIPLEYFGRAVEYLRGCGQVRPHQIAAVGGSKGGEAALLAASVFPGITAAVSLLGSGVVTQGISQDVLTGSFLEIMGTPVPCWTHQDRELPYLPNVVTPELERLVKEGSPVTLRMAFEPALAAAGTRLLSAAAIPVERINGPVLLISATDDEGYGRAFHDIAEQRLASGTRHSWEHVVHEDAGHGIIASPYRPTTVTTSPGPGVTFSHGGTPEANARACAATWQATIRFLRTAFAPA
ncbi:MAG TPA: acyl-CoA thioesterase/bile acid-CoA:amino acid N-acyltransferase family protein [Trebonia sp.]|jgi:dienelactone hydrolase